MLIVESRCLKFTEHVFHESQSFTEPVAEPVAELVAEGIP